MRRPYFGIDREIVVTFLLLVFLVGAAALISFRVSMWIVGDTKMDEPRLECPDGHPVVENLFVDELDRLAPETRCDLKTCPWLLVWRPDDIQDRSTPESGEWRWTQAP